MARIMIVDDAQFMRKMLSDILDASGFDIVGEATNGREAIERYNETHPDLVTMDVVMPLMSGVDATRTIVNEHPSARIVMVSTMGQDAMILEAMEAGAKDYVVKPFRREEVVEVIQRVLEDD